MSLIVSISSGGIICADALLDAGRQLFGLFDAGSGRGAQVELHHPRIHRREKVRAHQEKQSDADGGKNGDHHQSEDPMAEDHLRARPYVSRNRSKPRSREASIREISLRIPAGRGDDPAGCRRSGPCRLP